MDKTKNRSLKEGDRVRLTAFEDQPEEEGEIEDVDLDSGLVYVYVDKKYRKGKADDGLREVPIEQVKERL